MRYVVEITGPNGNGWYEPRYYKDGWGLNDRGHPMDEIHPIPEYMIEDLLQWLNTKFAFNYKVKIIPFTDN